MEDGLGAVIRDLQTLFDEGAHGIHSDAQLLDGFVARGDAAAFEAIVRRHGSMVWGVCRRLLRDHHDAEDAFQATFLVLARRATSIVPREKLGNWLYGVARQTALKARAVRARRRGRELPMPVLPAHDAVREQPTDDRLLHLDRELSRLPEKYRAPIVLCELEGRTHRQAAEQLGWPVGTLSGRLSRARALLARRLSRRGLTLSAGSLEVMFAQDAAPACVPPSVLSSTIKAAILGTASQTPAASVISPKVAALTEGVIRRMMMIRFTSIAATSVLALGLCGIAGAVVELGRDDEGPGQAATTTTIPQKKGAAGQAKSSQQAGDGTTALLKARPGLAQKGYEASFDALRQTTRFGDVLVVIGKPEEVYRWSIRWLQADRDLSPKGADPLAALEAHLKRTTDLQKRVEALNREILPNTAKLEAEWYVQEARLWLEQAKAKSHGEPLPR